MSDLSAPQSDEVPVKRRKIVLTLDKKLDIIQRLQNGESAASVGRLYKINESSVRTIRKNSEKIFNSVSSNNLNAKVCQRVRHPVLEKMEQLLVHWLVGQNDQSIALTSTLIREQATQLYQVLQEEDPSAVPFLASKGWFMKFCKRHNLRYVELPNDRVNVHEELPDDDSAVCRRTYVIDEAVSDEEQSADGEAAKTKWRSLRDYYRHEQKRSQSSSSYESSWNHYDRMTFLKDGTRRNPLPQRDVEVQEDEYRHVDHLPVEPVVKLEYEEDNDDPITSSTEFGTNLFGYEGDNSSKKRPNSTHADTDNTNADTDRRKLVVLEKLVLDNEDDDLQFFKSLIPDVRDLPRARKAHLRLKIQQLVCQEVYGESMPNGVKENSTIMS